MAAGGIPGQDALANGFVGPLEGGDILDDLLIRTLKGVSPPETYLSHVVDSVWKHLKSNLLLTTKYKDTSISAVVCHTDPNTSSIFADRNGTITVGLREVVRFSNSCLELSEHLTKNCVFRTMALGDLKGPSTFASISDFPRRALSLASGSELDGYRAPITDQIILRAERSLFDVSPVEEAGPIPSLPFEPSNTNAASGKYHLFLQPQDGPYLIRLFHRILGDALTLTLAHELGHVVLGHLKILPVPVSDRRRMEAEADSFAVELLLATADWTTLKAALWVFRLLHTKEPPTAGNLSHPYSRDRIHLLSRAIAQPGCPRGMRNELNSILQTLSVFHRKDSTVATYGNCETTIESSRDLDALNIKMTLTSLTQPGEEFLYGQRLNEVFELTIQYRDAIDSDREYASGFAHLVTVKRADWYQIKGDRTAHTFVFRVRPPPVWRQLAPGGVLELISIKTVPEPYATKFAENTASSVDSAKERATRSKNAIDLLRIVHWPQPPEVLLSIPDLRDGVSLENRDLAELLEWAQWCEDYGYFNEATALRSFVIAAAPEIAGYDIAMSAVETLRDAGELQRAGELASAYISELGPRPGMPVTVGEACAEREELVLAFEAAFIEVHCYGEGSDYFERANALLFRCLGDSTSDEMAVLRQWHQLYGEAVDRVWRSVRRRRLVKTIPLLQYFTQRYSELISVRQLWAELHADLGKLGDVAAEEIARREYAKVIADYPWFVPALIQAAYLALRMGDKGKALDLFRRAEDLAPLHRQVREARKLRRLRFFGQWDKLRTDRSKRI